MSPGIVFGILDLVGEAACLKTGPTEITGTTVPGLEETPPFRNGCFGSLASDRGSPLKNFGPCCGLCTGAPGVTRKSCRVARS